MADNLPAKTGEYGDLQVSGTIGLDDFKEHDHAQAWDDQGQAAELGRQIGELLSSYGAEQAKQGGIEYLTASTGQLRQIQKRICFVLDASNNLVKFGALWKQMDLQLKAIEQAAAAGDATFIRTLMGEVDAVSAKCREVLGVADGGFPEPERAAEPAPRPSRRLPGPGTRAPRAPTDSAVVTSEQRAAGPRAKQPARRQTQSVPVIRQNVFGDDAASGDEE